MPLFQGTITIHAKGALLIGGHSQPQGYLDSTTAQQKHQKNRAYREPIIPASALRGAIREALTQMLNGLNQEGEDHNTQSILASIFGAPGHDHTPRHSSERIQEQTQEPDMGQQRLMFSDATKTREEPIDFQVRHGVSINRKTGHADQGKYYQREVANAANHSFSTPFTINTSEHNFQLLQDALTLINTIGNSKSRGLGHVEVSLRTEALSPIKLLETAKEAHHHTLTLTTASPLFLGGFSVRSFFQESLSYIPGSAIRGAFIWMMVRAGKDQDTEFQQFVDTVSFSDFWPRGTSENPTGPAPRTLLQTKRCPPKETQQLDSILLRTLTQSFAQQGEPTTIRDKNNRIMKPSNPLLDYQLGHIVETHKANIVTRLEIDPKTGSSKQGRLYSRKQIIQGAEFIGTVSGLTPALQTWLNSSTIPIQIGGLRAKGLGKVKTLKPKPLSNSVQRRIQRYNQKIQQHLPSSLLAKLNKSDRFFVQVVARTPLCPSDNPKEEFSLDEAGVGQMLLRTLFPTLSGGIVEYTAQRDDVRSGWADTRFQKGKAAQAPVLQVLSAGSTWLLSFPKDQEQHLDTNLLFAKENTGIGASTELGLGRVFLCPDLPLFPKGA